MQIKPLLFATRNYPPILGGMEQYSYDFYQTMKEHGTVSLFANRRGKRFLIIYFLGLAFHITFFHRRYSHFHFSDGVMAPLAWFAKKISTKSTSITVHGLDITYNNTLYQKIIPKFINKLDRVICVSNYTMSECIKRGIEPQKCTVIPNGIKSENMHLSEDNNHITEKFGLPFSCRKKPQQKKVLFSLGRMIERKGVVWFVEEVMPKLSKDIIYIIAGIGKSQNNLNRMIIEKKLSSQVYLLGRISAVEKAYFLTHSDYFIMPNIEVEGDSEGFGITLIEAGYYGTPSIASNLQGIKDAVINGKTGTLVKPNNVDSFVDAIKNSSFDRTQVKQLVLENYDWDNLIVRYLSLFDELH